MKLPEINPASPVPQNAESLVQAGREFGAAAGEWAKTTFDIRKDELTQESHAAAVRVATAAHEVEQTIKSQPYVPVDTAKGWFGGTLPEGVEATRTVIENGVAKTVEAPVVPMHKIANKLYQQKMDDAVETAAAGITAPGWAEKFRVHAAGTVEAKRGEILDWQRAQYLADQQVRTVGNFQAAVRIGSWSLAEQIALSGQAGVVESQKMLQELPRLKADSEILQGLDTMNPGLVQETMKKVRSGEYSKLFDAKEEQHYLNLGERQLAVIEAAAEKAKKQREEAAAARVANVISAGLVAVSDPKSPLYGKTLAQVIPVRLVESIPNLKPEDKLKYLDLIRTGGKPNDDDDTLARMYEAVRVEKAFPGQGIGRMSREELLARKPFLTQEHWDYFAKQWEVANGQKTESPVVKASEAKARRLAWEMLTSKENGRGFSKDDFNTHLAQEAIIEGLHPLILKKAEAGEEITAAEVAKGVTGYTPNKPGAVWGVNPPAGWAKKAPPEAQAFFPESLRKSGQLPSEKRVAEEWEKAEAAKDSMVKVWGLVNPAVPFGPGEQALLWAMELNPANRAEADAKVADLAKQGRPMVGLSEQEKRFAVYSSMPTVFDPASLDIIAKRQAEAEAKANLEKISASKGTAAGREEDAAKVEATARKAEEDAREEMRLLSLSQFSGVLDRERQALQRRQEGERMRIDPATGRVPADVAARMQAELDALKQKHSEMRTAKQLQLEDDKEAYKLYEERMLVGPDGSRLVFAPANMLTYSQFVRARARGESP